MIGVEVKRTAAMQGARHVILLI